MEERNATIDPIVLETNETLLSILYFWMLAIRIAGLGLSRLGATAWLDEKLFCWPGEIVYADGTPFRLYEDIIDDAYRWEESYSWNTNVKRIAVCGPKRCPNRNLLLRLQLWDAAFKIDADPVLPIE